ncbi:PLAT/LH2 domain-containing protein, partial [Streptomyces klenkii]
AIPGVDVVVDTALVTAAIVETIIDLFKTGAGPLEPGKVKAGCATPATVDYKVTITTADEYQAGTDSNLRLIIKGSCGNTHQVTLNPLLSGNAFERGDVDEVTLKSYENVGALQGAEISSDGRYSASAWKMSSLKITNEADKKSITVKCDQWIDGDSWNLTPGGCTKKN